MMDSQQDSEVHIDLAHRERRRADRFLLAHKFDEAVSAHQDAISQLEKVLAFAKNPVVRESIQLQIAFHGRQQQIVNYNRRRHYSLQSRQSSISYFTKTGGGIDVGVMPLPDQPLEQGESDALKMHSLLNKNSELLQQWLKKSKESKSLNDDSQIIDDLRANNTELRATLQSLANDNSSLRRRNMELEEQIAFLKSQLSQVEQSRIVIPDLAPLERPDFD